jgi:hypothetical protein
MAISEKDTEITIIVCTLCEKIPKNKLKMIQSNLKF